MYTSFEKIKSAIKSGTSTVDIVNFFLQKIEEKKHLNTYLEVFSESAILKAKEVDEKIKTGNAGRLAGMVIGIKDNTIILLPSYQHCSCGRLSFSIYG